MRFLKGLLLIAIGAGGALAADRYLLTEDVLPVSGSGSPPIERTAQEPGDPPLVWIGGTLEEVGDSQMILRKGDGPEIVL